ncbi:competence/damage-inducible protein A [Phreatobacter sp.]|uniref:competence/damage-inducible protein A n=1 Tax=Phreatobacter sp. TaxID=1966341 RepID=UPI003F6E7311
MNTTPETVTAAILVIGDEILSGRTKDRNIGYIAEYLTALGIDTKEVRVVPDEEDEIVTALNALRGRYDYVFTTGGIGPTHDDITADCIAKAFGVDISVNAQARAMLLERIAEKDLNEARLRMARIPHGAELIENPVSKAPGFMIGNVITMAGVPSVMQAMMDVVSPRLRTGVKMIQVSIEAAGLKEGDIGSEYGTIAKAHPGVIMGSYPMMQEGRFWTRLVLRAKDAGLLAAAEKDVVAMVEQNKPPQSQIVITRPEA